MEVMIERLGREGDGIAGAVRLPFALPGERWEVPDDGNAATLLAASPVRVGPPCPHFGTCGGCSLQHASDAFVAEWKAGTIVRALAAQRIEAEVAPTLTAPPRSRRRAVFAGRRTRKTAITGFHERRSEAVVDVRGCLVVRPELLAARPALARLTALGATRTSTLRLTVTCGPAGLDVAVAEGRALDTVAQGALAALAEETDLARLSWDGEVVALRRPPFQVIGSARVVPPPGAFLQPTAEGAAALATAVRAATDGAGRVADLFAGCGTFALPLAQTAEVLAVEGDAAMLAALSAALRKARGLKRVSVAARDLFRRPLLASELDGFDAVVIDPPRAGAEAQSRELAHSSVRRIAAVSCDPATFARDARILIDGGYRLDRVQPIDQFRWSGHVEMAASFTRQRA